jgi:hypothetical protein
MTCKATYRVTREDFREGSVKNTVVATGTPPGGPAVSSLPSSAEVTTAPGHGHHDRPQKPHRPGHDGHHKPDRPHHKPQKPLGDGHREKGPRRAA